MCQTKLEKFKNKRELEDWARKERERRVNMMLVAHENDNSIATESIYFKKKNILWKESLLKYKYFVTTLRNLDSKKVNKIEVHTITVMCLS